jgi:hypothetical protein
VNFDICIRPMKSAHAFILAGIRYG